MEACRIVILSRGVGVVDVAAPMKHKDLCYNILQDAKQVILDTSDPRAFQPLILPDARLVIVMGMDGRVDVAAPMPPREFSLEMLKLARVVIEKYDDAEAPPMRPFDYKMLGKPA